MIMAPDYVRRFSATNTCMKVVVKLIKRHGFYPLLDALSALWYEDETENLIHESKLRTTKLLCWELSKLHDPQPKQQIEPTKQLAILGEFIERITNLDPDLLMAIGLNPSEKLKVSLVYLMVHGRPSESYYSSESYYYRLIIETDSIPHAFALKGFLSRLTEAAKGLVYEVSLQSPNGAILFQQAVGESWIEEGF